MTKKLDVRPRKQKLVITVYALLAIIAALVLAVAVFFIYFPNMNPYPSLDPRNQVQMEYESSHPMALISVNEEINARYNSTIYYEGKERIDSELKKTRLIQDPVGRLDEIFVWEMKDWIRPNDNITAFRCLDIACSYIFLDSDPTRLRASPYWDGIIYPQKNTNGTEFDEDPNWIAYNKVGECEELSTLFAYMAKESGIPSQLVNSRSHQWTEVQLSDGSYYYDPWCADANHYYNADDGNMTFRNKWFNRIGSFEENCHPPDPRFPITYNTFPYVFASIKYPLEYTQHTLDIELNQS